MGLYLFCRKCDSNSNMSKLFSCISVAVIACTHNCEICLENIASKTFTPIDVREYCWSLFLIRKLCTFLLHIMEHDSCISLCQLASKNKISFPDAASMKLHFSSQQIGMGIYECRFSQPRQPGQNVLALFIFVLDILLPRNSSLTALILRIGTNISSYLSYCGKTLATLSRDLVERD